MAIGTSRTVTFTPEYGEPNAFYTTVAANAAGAATTLSIVEKGGANFGAPTVVAGMKVFFEGVKETPKTISAVGAVSVVGGVNTYPLTIPALTNAMTAGQKIIISYGPSQAALADSFGLKINPNKWATEAYTGYRGKNMAMRSGRTEADGDASFMLRASVNMPFIASAIGHDYVTGEAHVTAYAPAVTVATASAAGTVTLIVDDAADIAVNHLIQIGGGTSSEIRKVTVISTNTLTLDYPLKYAHEIAEAVIRVKSVADGGKFTHTIPSAPVHLPTMTIEDFVPFEGTSAVSLTGYSYLATGAVMKSLKVESQAENGLKADVSFVCQDKAQVGKSPAIPVPYEDVFAYQEEAWLIGSSPLTSANQLYVVSESSIEVDNDPQSVFTKNNSSRVFTIKAGQQEVKGSFKFYEIETAQQAYWDALKRDTVLALKWKVTNATTGYYVQFDVPRIVVTEFEDSDFSPGDAIYASVSFTGIMDAGVTNEQIRMTVVNGDYLTY